MKKVFKGFTPVKRCGLSPLASFYSRPRRHMWRKRSMLKNVVAPSLVRINIDSFVVLVSGKFPCFLEIDILFISTTSWEPNWRRFIPRAMQCLSQLLTKEQTHLLKIWDTFQTCREENAILLVWSQDKYYFNFYEFLKLSRACDIV